MFNEKKENRIRKSLREDNMHRLKLIIFCLLLAIIVCLPSAALAETYYVDPDNGNDSWDGTSEAPWRTIAKAKSSVADGSTVYLRSGNYGDFIYKADSDFPHYTGSMDEPLPENTEYVTWKAYPGETPVFTHIELGDTAAGKYYKIAYIFEDIRVEGQGLIGDIRLEHAVGVRFRNLTVIGPTNAAGKGIELAYKNNDIKIENSTVHTYNRGISAKASNVVISGNDVYDIGEDHLSIDISGTHPEGNKNILIENNHLHYNNRPNQGEHPDGIVINGSPSTPISNIIIRGNILHGLESQGGYLAGNNLLIENNLFYDISSTEAHIGHYGNNITFRNNTIIGHYYPEKKMGLVRFWNESSDVKIYNNIFICDYGRPAGSVYQDYNVHINKGAGPTEDNSYGFIDWQTALAELFVDPYNYDFRLKAGSPAIDRGDPDYANYVPGPSETDLDGNPRVIDGRVDIGCYEYSGGPVDTTPPTTPQNLISQAVSESQVDLTWEPSTDPETGISYYKIYRDNTQIGTSTSTSYQDQGLSPETTYTYEVSAVSGAGLESARSSSASATTLQDITPPVISNIQASVITTNEATITWTTNEPATSQVEYGLTTSYGDITTLYQTLVTSHSVTLTGLTEATIYHYRAKSTDARGNEVISSDNAFTTILPGPNRIIIGSNNELIISGEKFFPIFVWDQRISGLDYLKGLGVNSIVGYDGGDGDVINWLDAGEARGMFMVPGVDYILSSSAPQETLANHPALIAGQICHEPESGAELPSEIQAREDNFKSQYPDILTLSMFSVEFYTPYRTRDYSWYYDYLMLGDIMSYDYYPVTGWNKPNRVYQLGEATYEAYVDYLSKSKPVWTIIEASDQDLIWTPPETRGPYDYEMRAEAWLSIVNGAKAIGYFTIAFNPFRWNNLTPQIEAEMIRTNTQITALKDIILAEDPTDVSVSVSATNGLTVQTMVKKYNNKAYIFAVEGDSSYDHTNIQSGVATFTLTGVPDNSIINVYDESRTIQASGNTFTDNFDELGVHIYEINLTGGSPVLDPIGNQSIGEGQTLTFTVNATDPDGDPITYSVQNKPTTASFVGQTFSWIPTHAEAGEHYVTFIASDGTYQDSETITITVGYAPVFDPIPDYTVTENNLLTFTVNATDADGNPLTYSASNRPQSANFDANTGEFSWTPTYAQVGIHSPTFTVSDGVYTDSETITITVNPADTDSDGLPDWWELQYFGDLAQGPQDDPDNDGFTNLQEYQNGTDPTVFDDVPSDLILHMKFDDDPSDGVLDSSSYGNHGTCPGGIPTLTTDRNGNLNSAYDFNGADDYVGLGNLDVIGNGLTISLWFKADDFSPDDVRLISKSNTTAEQSHYWMLSSISGPKLRFRLKTGTEPSSGTTTLIADTGSELGTGVWIHAACTYDGNTMKIYKDGVPVGSTPKTGTVSTNPNVPAWIGRNPDGYGPWDGVIDDVRIYNRALTESEILELYGGPLTHTLTISATAGGQTNPVAGSYTYTQGSTVSIQAIADTGYHFLNWSGDLSGNENPTTITMDSDKSLTANFQINTYTLTIDAIGGSVSKVPDKPAYNHGETITLTAIADAGYKFIRWSGDVPSGQEQDNPLTIIVDLNKTIIANFAIIAQQFGDLSEVKAYPNPFRVSEAKNNSLKFINLPDEVVLQIFNIFGEMVYKEEYTATGGRIDWDGNNNSGRPVATGLYIYLLTDREGHKKTGRISLIR